MKKWICEWERGRKAALQLGGKVRSDFFDKLCPEELLLRAFS